MDRFLKDRQGSAIHDEDSKTYIGIDFGMTRTCVAFRKGSNRNQEARTVRHWPQDENPNYPDREVATRVSYGTTPGDRRCGYEANAENGQLLITNFKLLFDESDYNKEARDELLQTMHDLKSQGLIEEDEDVIVHFLTYVFVHTKASVGQVETGTGSTFLSWANLADNA
jgi:hypothetical protein